VLNSKRAAEQRRLEAQKKETEKQIDENNRLSWLTNSIIDTLLNPEFKAANNDIINTMVELGENYWDDRKNIYLFIKKVLNVNDLAKIYNKDIEVMTNHIDEYGSLP